MSTGAEAQRCTGAEALACRCVAHRHEYRARVRIRRGPGYEVRPKAETLDGREVIVHVAWLITEDDREEYAGELAMMGRDLDPYAIGWIASGDLELLEVLS